MTLTTSRWNSGGASASSSASRAIALGCRTGQEPGEAALAVVQGDVNGHVRLLTALAREDVEGRIRQDIGNEAADADRVALTEGGSQSQG